MSKKEQKPLEEEEEKVEEKTVEEEEVIESDAEPESEQPTEPTELEQKLMAQLLAEKDRYLRLAAEYENFRRRSAKERENIYADIRSDTVQKFLPVYDNLSRALEQETADAAYRKGVEMIMTQLEGVLDKFGVKKIDALGEKFDPEKHDAVMHVEDESAGEGVIVREFEKGFMMGDKVIRFSMVAVAN